MLSLVSSLRAIKDLVATSAIATFADDGSCFFHFGVQQAQVGWGQNIQQWLRIRGGWAGGKRLKDFPARYHGHVRAVRGTIDSGALGQFEFDLVVPQGTVIDLSVMCERGQMCGDLQTGAWHDAKTPSLGDEFC